MKAQLFGMRGLSIASLVVTASLLGLSLMAQGETPATSSTAATEPATANAISVQLAQMPVPFVGVDQAPVYMTLINSSDKALLLVGASSELAHTVELVDAAAKPLSQLVIPAHGQLQLQKNSPYLRLKGLKYSIRSGEQLHLQLRFHAAPSLEVSVMAISSYDQPHH